MTDRLVKRGVFTLTETEIPGYAASWVCVDATGATISTSNQVFVPVDVTDLGQLDITCTVTNTFAALDIDISGSAINPVGEQHTFTLTATSSTDGVNFTPLAGALLDLDFTTEDRPRHRRHHVRVEHVRDRARHRRERAVHGHGAIECVRRPERDRQRVHEPGAERPQPGPAVRAVDRRCRRTRSGSSTASKAKHPTSTWSASRTPSRSAAPRSRARTRVRCRQGALITFTWSGPGTPTGPTVTPSGTGFQCIVGADGTCEVTVTSATPASGTLTVTGIVVDLPNGETATSTTTYTLTYPDAALQEPAPSSPSRGPRST